MATEGGAEERKLAVARVASRLFGATVKPENVVTETLRRVTDDNAAKDMASLSAAITAGLPDHSNYSTILRHPIAAWVETTLGLQREDDDPKGNGSGRADRGR